MKTFYVYILGSTTGTLYIGVTSNIETRLRQHVNDKSSGFTKKYHVTKLIYLEECEDSLEAIAREKQLKGWRRSKKLDLIKTQNPTFTDLAQS